MTNDPKTNKYYVVVAREEYKEEDVIYYHGKYSTDELEKMATEEDREHYDSVYIKLS